MTGPFETGAISRAIRDISLEPAIALERRREMLAFDSLQESEQQIQIPFSGTATGAAAWTEQTIAFDLEFHHAPEQRWAPFTVPHFTYGPVVTSPEPVVVSACVRSWRRRDDDAIIGAVVAVAAYAPGAVQGVEFNGYLHCSFQGFAAPAETGVDLDTSE